MWKYLVLIISLLVNGCGSSDSNTSNTETRLPIEQGLYSQSLYGMGTYYEEISSSDSEDVSVRSYIFNYDSLEFKSEDISSVEGGMLYVLLTNSGWEYFDTVTRDKYYLDENGNLINSIGFIDFRYELVEEKSLSNLDIEEELGEGYSWATGYTFSEDAKQYFYNRIFPEDIWIVPSEYCGPDCYGIRSLGGGELLDWKDKYIAVSSPDVEEGFYWYGMSLFFNDGGKLEVYSYFDQERGMLSSEGSWKIITINGEEVLEITVPSAIKNEFGLIDEVNPIVTKVKQTIFRGHKYSSSLSISDDKIGKGYFFNYSANEDLKSALISVQ